MKDLQEVNSQFQRVKEKIQKLEEVLSKARKLQEQKLILQAGSKYLPMEEIEMIIQKSDAKIEDAKILHKLIEELRKKSGYMTESEIKSLAETLQMLETRLKMGGSFSDGNSATICNENNDEDGNRVDHEEDADNNNDKIDDDGEVDDIDDDDNQDGEVDVIDDDEVDDDKDVDDYDELDDNEEPDDNDEEGVDYEGIDFASLDQTTNQS